MVTRITATLDRQVSNKLTFFLLFLLPFVIAPFGVTEFENPKVVIAQAAIIALFLLSFFRKQTPQEFNWREYLLAGAVVLLSLLQWMLFPTDIALFGNDFRMQGIFLLWLLVLFSVLVRNQTTQLINTGLVMVIVAVFLGATLLLPINESNRHVGTLGEPNASAALLIFLWPFFWFTQKLESRKKLLLSCGLLTATLLSILVLFKSHSALLAFAIQMVFLALNKLKIPLKKSLILVSGILLISMVLPFINQNSIYENRSDVWNAAVYAGWKHPLIGGGMGNTETLIHEAASNLNLPVQYSYVDSSHNIFLDWWVQGGLAGISLLVIILYRTTKQLIQKQLILQLTVLIGLVTALSFNPASIVGLVQLWWLIGHAEQKNITSSASE